MRPFPTNRRCGTTLLEIVVAIGLLAAVMTLAVQLLGWMSVERRMNQRRQVALQEAANCLELMRSLPWAELTQERADRISPSSATQQLPGGELQVNVEDDPAEPAARRIAVQVRWRHRSGDFEAPVRLTTWRWEE